MDSETTKKRVSISKLQRQDGPGAELLALCQEIMEDGIVTNREVSKLAYWLRDNKTAELPAVSFLIDCIKLIVAEGKVTEASRKELVSAIEKVLPPDARKAATVARKEVEARAKAAEREIKQAEREAKQAALRVEIERREESMKWGENNDIWHYPTRVAGVTHSNRDGGNRQSYIARLRPGVELYFRAEDDNPVDPDAVQIVTKSGAQIGYAPESAAGAIRNSLHKGTKYRVFVTQITGGTKGKETLGCNLVVLVIPPGCPDSHVGEYLNKTIPAEFPTLRNKLGRGCFGLIVVGVFAALKAL